MLVSRLAPGVGSSGDHESVIPVLFHLLKSLRESLKLRLDLEYLPVWSVQVFPQVRGDTESDRGRVPIPVGLHLRGAFPSVARRRMQKNVSEGQTAKNHLQSAGPLRNDRVSKGAQQTSPRGSRQIAGFDRKSRGSGPTVSDHAAPGDQKAQCRAPLEGCRELGQPADLQP